MIRDIFGALWPSPANDVPMRLPSHGKPSAAPGHGGDRAPDVPMLLW